MNKYNIIASQVENDTTASFPLLMENEKFVNLFNKNKEKPINEIVKILSKYANNNLI